MFYDSSAKFVDMTYGMFLIKIYGITCSYLQDKEILILKKMLTLPVLLSSSSLWIMSIFVSEFVLLICRVTCLVLQLTFVTCFPYTLPFQHAAVRWWWVDRWGWQWEWGWWHDQFFKNVICSVAKKWQAEASWRPNWSSEWYCSWFFWKLCKIICTITSDTNLDIFSVQVQLILTIVCALSCMSL